MSADHDPLCLLQNDAEPERCHYCRLIARVRADERQQARQRVEALDGWQDSGTIHECVVVEQADAAAAAGGDA